MIQIFIVKAMSLERHTRIVRCSVVHEPYGHGQRRQKTTNIGRHDLATLSIEAGVPLGEDGARARCELNARERLPPQGLVELMRLHRDELSKHLVLEVDQGSVSELVFDVEP